MRGREWVDRDLYPFESRYPTSVRAACTTLMRGAVPSG